MKTINKLIILLLPLFVLNIIGCTDDYDTINTNPNSPITVPGSNVLGAAIMNTSSQLFGERIGIYYAGTWSGHNSAIGLGDYEYRVDINNSQWQGLYIIASNFVTAMEIAEKEGNNNLYAAALTMKVYVMHKISDMWGPIPYRQAFKMAEEGIMYPEYDNESVVYDNIFADLEVAVSKFDAAGKPIGPGDILFNGNIDKWIRFANSLRLRAAIRISNVDQAKATAIISAVASRPLMTELSQNAYHIWPGDDQRNEPWFVRLGRTGTQVKTDQYRMNSVIIDLLKDLNDPRLPVYADKNERGIYNGYRHGPNQRTDTMNFPINVSHIANRWMNSKNGFSPYMMAAETHFNLAEAYARNMIQGNARQAYENGIKLAMQDNGIAQSAIDAYLAQPKVAWDQGGIPNLTKIYQQKWISLFKQGVEAWAENRRTDVPLQTGVEPNYSGTHNRPPFRMSWSDTELSLNPNAKKTGVVTTDIFYGTQMWWDKRTGVK
ncbi:MAG: SusD/RagB family nutrient-binding outer membrane lipoprotein [Draconibacterium sp.]|nr:SusD/RagB family nutrient-binding outer membrane lipoprotein [Draconibacterium sp.]